MRFSIRSSFRASIKSAIGGDEQLEEYQKAVNRWVNAGKIYAITFRID